jgi:hypothetical protein
MEPDHTVETALVDVLGELSRMEETLHWPRAGTSKADLERLTVEDFCETGASGRWYSRAFVMEELERRMATPHPQAWEISDLRCRQLGSDVYLLTYALVQDRVRHTRRATIWQRTGDGWRAVYHQGTIVKDRE